MYNENTEKAIETAHETINSITLEIAKALAEANGRPWNEMGAYEQQDYRNLARDELGLA